MATTVGQHAVSTFTTPQNGDALNADIVRGNDNTLRTQYVDHDADPGIHVQSSSLASRPSASVAGSGTKWINSDHPQKLWISDGTNWHEVGGDSINIYCKATETLVKGDIVKVTGFNTGQDVAEIAKVASASDVAFGIVEADIANGALGYVVNTGILEDVNTVAFAIGNILYPNTSGGLTTTKPTSGSYQPVAYVLRAHASNGVLYVEFSAPRTVEVSANTASTVVLRDASGNFSAGTITATLVGSASSLTTSRSINGVAFNGTADITVPAAAGTLTGATLASGVTASSLTSVGTLTGLTVSGVSNLADGTAGAPGITFSADTNTGFFRPSADTVALTTGGTERFRMGGGGLYPKFSDLGTYQSSTGTYPEIRTSANPSSNFMLYASHTNASPQGVYLKFASASPDNSTVQYFLICEDSTTARCYIWSDGDLANHDGVYGTISDEALKRDIVDASSQWDDIKAVRFRKYRMKTDVEANSDAPFMLGVVAQEIAQTSPGLVDEHANADGTTTKTVKSSILLMKAAVALQEAMTRIEALEARVATLEAGA